MTSSDLGPVGISGMGSSSTLTGNRIDDPRVEMARSLTKKVFSELVDQALAASDALLTVDLE